jgi:vacuolar-type H+-ATPase subunit D/Vma8
VAQCSRRVRTLEQHVAPQLNAQILNLKQTLEEREREEHLRLKHVQRRMTRG